MTDYAVQANFSIPHSADQYAKSDLINVQGDSVQEFHANLTALNGHCLDLIAQVGANLRALGATAGTLGARTIEHTQNASGAPNGGQAAQAPGQYQNGPQNGTQAPQTGNVDPWTGQPNGQSQPPWSQDPNQGQQQWQQPQQGQQWQGQQQAPANNGIPTQPPPHAGPPPSCSHGVKKYLAKPYSNGKPGYWQAWACPADKRQDATAHDLEFIRNK